MADNNMKINLKELKESYQKWFYRNELFDNCNVQLFMNTRRTEYGCASLSMVVESPENNGKVATTLYIVEKDKVVVAIFVNDDTHAIVWNKVSPNALDRAADYIHKYMERSTMRLLGKEVGDLEKTKKVEAKVASENTESESEQ